ncbi:MAG: alanine--tRNA ligase-related protein [Bdellovibrionales bacterium]
MQTTVLTYMEDQYCLESEGKLVAIEEEEGRTFLLLDQTIFYPQGGGQACDQGTITSSSGATFHVEDVRFIDGLVRHYGTFENGTLAIGDSITCHVDGARRQLNSRLHSAGHLLDEAVKNLGYGWVPTKGIHFPGKMAVEYDGDLQDGETARTAIEAEANRLIESALAIEAKLVSVKDLPDVADYIPPNLPTDKPVRVVTMTRNKGTPCGGTHVATTADIGKLTIRYVKNKRGSIKVAYEVE